MKVYELSWWYIDEESGDSDEQVIAVYASKELAKRAMEKFKKQPRFVGHENDFYIDEYTINKNEWAEGYWWDGDHKGESLWDEDEFEEE